MLPPQPHQAHVRANRMSKTWAMALPRGPNHIPSLHLSAGHGNPRFNSDENRSRPRIGNTPASRSRTELALRSTLQHFAQRMPARLLVLKEGRTSKVSWRGTFGAV